MRTVYVIGYPGSGKSTLVRDALLLAGANDEFPVEQPVPHIRYVRHANNEMSDLRIWEIGRHRWSFSGTDALGMAINPHAVTFAVGLAVTAEADAKMGTAHAPLVLLGEGDRLANRAFLSACPNLTLVLAECPLDLAKERAVERAGKLGTRPQADSWWKGRVTKTDNLWRWGQDQPEIICRSLSTQSEYSPHELKGILTDASNG